MADSNGKTVSEQQSRVQQAIAHNPINISSHRITSSQTRSPAHLDVARNGAGGAGHRQRPRGGPPTSPEVLQAGLLAGQHRHEGALVLGVHAARRNFARIVRGYVAGQCILQGATHNLLGFELGRGRNGRFRGGLR